MTRVKINLVALLGIIAVGSVFAQEGGAAAEVSDVMSLIADESSLSEYAAMIETAGLAEKLDGLDTGTIFIPTNDAVNAYKSQTGDSLSDASTIEQFVFSNIVGEAIAPEMFPADGVMTNLAGSYMTLSAEDGAQANSSPVEYLGTVADAAAGTKLYVYVMKEYNTVIRS